MKLSPWGILSCAALVAGVVALAPGRDVSAAVAQQPLTLAGAVKPNLMLVLDDSGSMDWEVLFPTDQGVLYWGFDADRFVDDDGRFFENEPGGDGRPYSYLFPNGTGNGNKAYPNLTGNGNEGAFSSAVPPRPEFAFARSADYNSQYYNPSLTYRPWVNSGGNVFANAVPTAALSDPMVPGSATLNLASTVLATNDEWRFRRSGGMRAVAAGGVPGDTVANGAALEAYSYYPATYYVRTTASYALPNWIGGNCANPASPARYRSFVSGWTAARQASDLSGAVYAIAPDGACLSRYEIRAGNAFPSGRSYADELQNFANWFQYHRKRHMALRASLGSVFDSVGGARVGGIRINSASGAVAMRDVDVAGDKQGLYSFFYGMTGAQRGTPNRQALLHAAQQFDTNADIVQYACQKNFALHFTDGYTNIPGSGTVNVGNADGTLGAPYADGYSNAIADIAARYYRRIRTDLPSGQVPAPPECGSPGSPAANPPAGTDCNFDPHMNTYGITLGAVGNIFGVTHQSVANAYANPPAWPNPATDGKPQVDDLYHAAVNGRGEMLNATSTQQLTEKLRDAIAEILTRGAGSGSRTAASSTRAAAGTQLFQARFNATQWTGELLAFQITTGGNLGALNWNAATAMPAHGARDIYFANGNQLAEFEWNNLSAAQQLGLNLNPAAPALSDNLGERRVRWLRGDMSAQALAGGQKLRDRATALGDIVNSSPRYVGTENYGYDRLPAGAAGRDAYTAFRFDKADRQAMVYVGANDGMLHAFDADTGIEQWAFIPSEFLATSLAVPSPAIAQLPRSDYAHRYYVDGQPVAGDAYFDGAWHTVLVTPMGAGGRSVVAMDITDPAAPELLWEFDPSDDAAIGGVTGQPSIQRMANGRWAAIFGNGYGQAGSAKLFIVDIETGNLVRRIDTDPAVPAGTTNGLSAPYPVDTNGDAIIDMVYAGDLYGNMWRFDVDNALPAQWGVHHRQGVTPRPLITVCASGNVNGIYACPAASRQPITVRPVVGRGPQAAGQTVYFGTGKFFEDGDNQVSGSGPVQSFYAVFDDNNAQGASVAGRNALLQQRILDEVTLTNYGTYRVTSNNALGNQPGWVIDLVSPLLGFQGERVIADPILQGGRIIFTTLFPGDPCSGGSDGWLMELQGRDGSRFDAPILDVNGDGLFTQTTGGTQGDTVTHGGRQVAPSGVKSTVGGLQTPTIINIPGQGRQNKIMSGATGNTQQVGERDALPRGRTSWRQLWP